MDSNAMSKFATMLANGGVCIDSKERILPSNIVKNLFNCFVPALDIFKKKNSFSF